MKPLNRLPNPTRFTRLMAYLCLALALLTAIPCPATASPHATATISHHCDTCCPPSTTNLAKPCCTTVPQPAQTTPAHEPATTLIPTFVTLHPAIASPALAPTRPIPLHPAPSPPLHPILRI